MSSQVVALVGVALVLVLGVVAVNGAYANTGPHTDTSETFTPNAGTVTTLNESNSPALVYDTTVTVTDENGTLMLEGDDYTWYEQNGTIKTLAGGRLEGDTEATIDWGWNAPDREARAMASLMGHGLNIGSFTILILGVGLVLGAVRVFKRLDSRW